MSETPAVVCEKCGADSKKKIGGGNGIIFKGSGFYVNDYKSSGGKCDCSNSGSCPKE
jgi:predicted nucleic acid-binding Zn ribbon protein